jgi:hypothetical protein
MEEIKTIKYCSKCSKLEATLVPCDRSTICATCGEPLCILYCEIIKYKTLNFCSLVCKNKLLTVWKLNIPT